MIALLASTVLFVGPIALPAPTGASPVGTTVLHLTDKSRKDPIHPDRLREVMVQFWYPAAAKSTGLKMHYIPDDRLLQALIKGGYYSQSEDQLKSWGSTLTHATMNASIRPGKPLPVLLLMPGLGMPRSNYTIYSEDLASHGYFVASIDPPYGGETMLPDGHHLSASEDAMNGDPEKYPIRVHDWALDAKFVLDRLTEMNRAKPQTLVSGLLDVKAVGVFGHSMGGTAAFEATILDPRFQAAIDLDGQPAGECMTKGIPVSVLALRSDPNYSDADLAKRGRTRETWNKMGEAGRAAWSQLASKAQNTVTSVAIRDTGHLSYSDAPYMMPSTITQFSDHSLAPEATIRMTLRLIREYFDWMLLHKESPLLAGTENPEPGMSITYLKKV